MASSPPVQLGKRARPDQQQATIDDGSSRPAPGERAGGGASVTLFVSGLPSGLVGIRKRLKVALDSYGLRSCRVGVSCLNQPRTWAHISLAADSAERLMREQHRRLMLPGTPSDHPPVCFAPASGKLDILFPLLPASFRSRITMDATAHFSVTDQENAQRVTQMILCLLATAQRDPTTKLTNTLEVTRPSAIATEAVPSSSMPAVAASVSEPSTTSADQMDESQDAAEEQDAAAITVEQIFSPDASINRIVSEIAHASWSTWTDLEEPLVDDGTTALPPPPPSAPLRIATSPYIITDGCACAGGNALDFGRHFAYTNAIEFDEARAVHLQANVDLLRLSSRMTVLQADANIALPKLKQDVIFMDPPWGGSNYKELMATQGGDLMLGTTSLADLCWRLYEMDACRMIVLRVPFEYDHDRLASHMVRLPSELVTAASEAGVVIDPQDVPRPHPFKVLLEKVVLLVLCLPSRKEKEQARAKIFGGAPIAAASTGHSSTSSSADSSSPPPPPLHFTLRNLDSLIYVLNGFDAWHRGSTEPSFFDWEKQRWIACRRWRGCTGQAAVRVIPKDKQAELAKEGKGRAPGTMSERDKRKQLERREKDKAKLAAKFEAKQERKRLAAAEAEKTASSSAPTSDDACAASSSTPATDHTATPSEPSLARLPPAADAEMSC